MGIFALFKPNIEKMEAERNIASLIKALKYKRDKYVRERAAQSLGKIRDSRATEPLIEALKDEDKGVRIRAAEALGKLDNTTTVDPLIQALKDEDGDVRLSVAEALGNKVDRRAVEPLQALRDKFDERFKETAEKALQKIYMKGSSSLWDSFDAGVKERAKKQEKSRQRTSFTAEKMNETIKKCREFHNRYIKGYKTPGGFDTSDIGQFIKCIEEVGQFKNNEAVEVLEKILAFPHYLEIIDAVRNALKR